MSNIVCPNCGESYYAERYSTRTAMYYPAIWKDGVNQNPDGNIATTYCECINCHYEFSYKTQYDKIIDIALGRKIEPTPTIDWTINNLSNSNTTIDINTVYLPTNIAITQEESREEEIKRLEREIKSLGGNR